jgi:hypothetical protein
MSTRDNIDWCQRQSDNANETLDGIAGGCRTFVNGEEITANIAAKAIAIIASMTALIAAYSMLLR